MCDAQSTMFFRPWNVTESSDNRSSKNLNCDKNEKTTSPCMKQEDDQDSVMSTSTYEGSSVSSNSENEVSATNISRRRFRRTSEASIEAFSRSSSVSSEDAVPGNNLNLLNNFVYNSPSTSTASTNSVIHDNSMITNKVDSTMVNPWSIPNTAFSVDYLQRLGFTHNTSAALRDCSTLMPLNIGSTAIQTSTVSTTGQPFYYEYPGVHLTQGLYQPSVEHAVEMIHRQDVAAKQMKKLRPKKFRCEHCDVAFSNNGQLKGHIRIHTGERPFKCDADGCGKSFTRNEELTRHKRIHTGLRPHACVVCGKRFGRKDHLKKHTRTHENRDPYRMSAAALGMFALGHALPQGHPFPPYVYPI